MGEGKRIVIIGAGAAGMAAAIAAAGYADRAEYTEKTRDPVEVLVLEKNEKSGKKLYITGKGRCNLTNDAEPEEVFRQIVRNSRFLYSSFQNFDNQEVMEFFEALGLKLKVERGKRVFPESDKSSDVIKVLNREMERLGVVVRFHTEVEALLTESISNEKTEETFQKTTQNAKEMEETEKKVKQRKQKKQETTATPEKCICGVRLKGGERIFADEVIIATGGLSYPSTGSTGDGYRFAAQVGHQILPTRPSLVPFSSSEEWVHRLQGLSLKNVCVSLWQSGKCRYEEFGEMLFTHFGVSGPLILSASSLAGDFLSKEALIECPATLNIDLKPALSEEQLEQRLLRDVEAMKNKTIKTILEGLLPKSLIPVVLEKSNVSPEKKGNSFTKEERKRLCFLLKKLPIQIDGLRGYAEAIITKGGVSVKEVDPKTMESRLVTGLYFVGEVLDLDALTGGFNLQIAWSTGWAAGKACRIKKVQKHGELS